MNFLIVFLFAALILLILLAFKYQHERQESLKYKTLLHKIHKNFIHDLCTTEAGISETKKSGQHLSQRLVKTNHEVNSSDINVLKQLIDNGTTVKFNADIYAFKQGIRKKLSYETICKNQMLVEKLKPIVKKVYDTAKTKFNIEEPLYVSKIQFWRWERGQELRNHSDGHTFDMKTNQWVRMRGCNPDISSVWYLSEHGKDFHGGLLEFVDSVEKIIPRVGDLYVFESGPKNVHKMTRIINGNKYICTILLTKDPSSNDENSKLFLE